MTSKFPYLLLVLTLLTASCDTNFYGDLDLGGDFYYLTEPSLNSIIVPTDVERPYRSSSDVITNVLEFGYDKNYILASSLDDNITKYWIIDKNLPSKQLGYDESSGLKLSNVIPVDSTAYFNLIQEANIEVKPVLFYQKEAGWK